MPQIRTVCTVVIVAALSAAILACGGAGKRPPKAVASTTARSSTTSSKRPVVNYFSGYQTANKPVRGISYRTHQIGPYRNDGDQDLVGDEDGDNRADFDNDASWDYQPEVDENDYYHDGDDAHLVNFGHPASAADAQAVTSVVKRYYAAAARRDGSLACTLLEPTMALAAPLDYGRFGPSYLHGAKTCAAVLSRLFEHARAELGAPVSVTSVRIEGAHALAMIGSPKAPAGYIGLQLHAGRWGVAQLLGAAFS